ncbi:hypothetical protein GCM10009850_107130 [Nonomuraea monospora]|uniref:Uncharacterized protein n=1 Tax=Nonomuraea monospora TaxID=568818 RepID=A0ABN3D0F5_9ACTN
MRPEGRTLLEGDPALILEEGIGYVRAWSEAQHAVSGLRSALEAVGHGDALPFLHADVTEFGTGVVELGRVTPQTAELLMRALKLLAAQSDLSGDEFAA